MRHIHEAWQTVSELVEWRKSDEARLREKLRRRFLNRRVLIAGGIRNDERLATSAI